MTKIIEKRDGVVKEGQPTKDFLHRDELNKLIERIETEVRDLKNSIDIDELRARFSFIESIFEDIRWLLMDIEKGYATSIDSICHEYGLVRIEDVNRAIRGVLAVRVNKTITPDRCDTCGRWKVYHDQRLEWWCPQCQNPKKQINHKANER